MIAHELRNVLATVKEHTEHMEDMLSVSGSDGIHEKELLLESLTAIRGQISRGSNLAQRMNLFSHGPDSPESELDLNDLIEMLEPLSEPFLRKKRLIVNLIRPVRPMVMVGNPLRILMVLTGCMDFLMSLSAPKDTLEARVSRRSGRGIMVSFSSPSLENVIRYETWTPVQQQQWDELQALATSINARIGLIADRALVVAVFETEWI